MPINRKTSRLLNSPYVAWAVIFIIVPLFMVFYYGGEYSMGDENKEWPRCELLFFDWDGNFIKSVKLDTYIDATSFNPQTKILYGIPTSESDQDEVLLSYDLSSVIDW